MITLIGFLARMGTLIGVAVWLLLMQTIYLLRFGPVMGLLGLVIAGLWLAQVIAPRLLEV